jgi:hypothetical protein
MEPARMLNYSPGGFIVQKGRQARPGIAFLTFVLGMVTR